ncbi:MAG TPA: hypothetical protein VFD32_17150, partial [Dehalococcoidia bacterium]|nr:hypothetical protein [Dehalococcoidia bacterium]
MIRSGRSLLPLLIVAALLAACASSGEAKPVQIAQPLPDQESLSYDLLDRDGHQLGSAAVSIQRQGTALVLGQRYTDLSGHTDSLSATVDATTLLPQSAQRTINSADVQATLNLQYGNGQVTANVSYNGKQHHASEKLTSNSSYDDQESFFLMRTVDFVPGNVSHIALVVFDVAKGTISRAAASIRVQGATTLALGGKNFNAWQVQLSGAGSVNTAWF